MTDFIVPETDLLSDEEREDMNELFTKFAEAIQSTDENSMAEYFAYAEPRVAAGGAFQRMSFILMLKQFGILTEEEAAAALAGEELESVVDEDDFVDLDSINLADFEGRDSV